MLQVSTHGYSQNQILVWKYPSLTQVANLTGHSYRVLYLAMSPDGEAIVTGAGDETLRFWNVFSKARSQKVCLLNCSLGKISSNASHLRMTVMLVEIKNICCVFQLMF